MALHWNETSENVRTYGASGITYRGGGESTTLSFPEASGTIATEENTLGSIAADTGLKVSEKADRSQTISIDTDVVFVLDCNW